MRIEELTNPKNLTRPESSEVEIVPEGLQNAELVEAELVERDSKFSEDGKRVVLNSRVLVTTSDNKTASLYYSVTYSWSKRGKMCKLLEDLQMMPEPGENLKIADLIGIPVQVLVQNVDKDGVVYSNIVSIKRLPQKTAGIVKRSPLKLSVRNTIVPKGIPSPSPFEDEEYEED